MTDIIVFTVLSVMALGAAGWVLWNWLGASLGEVEQLERVGALEKWSVRIADVGGRPMVQLIFSGMGNKGRNEAHMFLNASQARLLSQWVRLAVTPGRTLADARRRSPRSS